ITVSDTTGFPSTGTIVIPAQTVTNGNTMTVKQYVNYTGKSDATFTGCTLGTGTVPNGTSVSLEIKYLWQQTSGATQTLIGYDRQKAILVSAHNGAYTFQLTASDGVSSSTDTCRITIQNPTSGTVRYVDNQLSANTTTYSIANRNNSGSDGLGYATLQAAANVQQPGDKIYVRAETYTDPYPNGNQANLVNMTTSGTKLNPIVWQNYN